MILICLCNKISHICCCKVKKKIGSVSISKTNLNKVKLKIKQLEYEEKRKAVINLAEKCALKFRNKSSSKKLSKYCMKMLQNFLGSDSILNSADIENIENLMKVYEQMFYKTQISSDDPNCVKSDVQGEKTNINFKYQYLCTCNQGYEVTIVI